MNSRDDTDVVLMLLLLLPLVEEDPFLAERFYERLRRRFRERKEWDPEIDMLFKRAMHYPERYDPELVEMLSHRLRDRLRRLEEWDPELDMLLDRALHRRSFPSRRIHEQAREAALSVVDGFKTSFQELVEDRLRKSEEALGSFRHEQEDSAQRLSLQERKMEAITDDLQDFSWLSSAGADIAEVPMRRYVPVRVFLGDPVPKDEAIQALMGAVENLSESIGFVKTDDFPPESGSWWKRVVLKTKEFLTHKDVSERLQKAEMAVQAAYLDKPQAEANQHQAQAASCLISSLAGTPHACVQVGTLLVVKATDETGGSAVFAATLSPSDLKHLEKNRSILRQPQQVLQWLQSKNKKGLTRRSTE